MKTKKDLIVQAYLLRGSHIIIQRVSPHYDQWRVIDCGYALSRKYKWNYMPIPSDRTPEWIDAHTFRGLNDALAALTATPEE